VAGPLAALTFVVLGVTELSPGPTDKTANCRVLASAPKPLPPGNPNAIFHQAALNLTFVSPGGRVARTVDCGDTVLDPHQALRIDYRPAALSVANGHGASLTCSVRRSVPGATDAATLSFIDDIGFHLDAALVCPGGPALDRATRVDYRPGDVGLRSFPASSDPLKDRGWLAGVRFAIAATFLASAGYGWWKTRQTYIIAPGGPRHAGPTPDARGAWEVQPSPGRSPTPVAWGAQPSPGRSPTTLRPTGPESVLYAGFASLMITLIGGIGTLAVGSVNSIAGFVAAGAVLVAVVMVPCAVMRSGRRHAWVIRVSDETLILTGPRGEVDVVSRGQTALVGVKSTHIGGIRGYRVSEINIWGPDGRLDARLAPAWPFGRSPRPLRRALRRHGWPQVMQSSLWGDRLFGYHPGRAPVVRFEGVGF
jgi:hypothetical protein